VFALDRRSQAIFPLHGGILPLHPLNLTIAARAQIPAFQQEKNAAVCPCISVLGNMNVNLIFQQLCWLPSALESISKHPVSI